jgi:hypothetical protein
MTALLVQPIAEATVLGLLPQLLLDSCHVDGLLGPAEVYVDVFPVRLILHSPLPVDLLELVHLVLVGTADLLLLGQPAQSHPIEALGLDVDAAATGEGGGSIP